MILTAFYFQNVWETYRPTPDSCLAGEMCGNKPGPEVRDGEGNGCPLQYSCLENPMDGGTWRATVHGVAKSWTRPRDLTSTFFFSFRSQGRGLQSRLITRWVTLSKSLPLSGLQLLHLHHKLICRTPKLSSSLVPRSDPLLAQVYPPCPVVCCLGLGFAPMTPPTPTHLSTLGTLVAWLTFLLARF